VLSPEDVRPVSDRSPARVVKILLESEALDVTWSHFGPHEAGAAPHVHRAHEDLFYVLDGEVTITIGPDREKLTAAAGTLVCIPPGIVHGFANESDEAMCYLNIHAPSMGFAAYLRGANDDFDQHEPPADGGRPTSDAIVAHGDVNVRTDNVEVRVDDRPGDHSLPLGDGRCVTVRAP
jgi:mannose-6-phosphate isomerase-like protein (cupin superfamily)